MPASYPTDESDIRTEKHTVKGVEYEVLFVPKTYLPHPAAYGYAYGKRLAHVRKDLPERIRNFVVQHELYHLRDPYSWGGTFGSELRANIIPGLSDPLGLLATIWATIRDQKRRKFYLDRIKGKI